ncbi:unnamed protein product, partial [Staurois parvus]
MSCQSAPAPYPAWFSFLSSLALFLSYSQMWAHYMAHNLLFMEF